MKDSKSKINLYQVLNSLNKKSIDSSELAKAKTRVWNQLSHSIAESNSSTEAKESVSKVTKFLFHYSYRKSFLTLGVIALVLIFSTGSVVYFNNKNKSNKNSPTANVNQNSPASKENTVLKELAAARFKELSGISYTEYKAVINPTSPSQGNQDSKNSKPESPVLDKSTGSVTLPGTPQEIILNKEKAADLGKKAESVAEQKVTYSEQEIKIGDVEKDSDFISLYYGVNSGKHPRIDYSKPVILKTWNGLNYSKRELLQDNKVVLFSLNSPEYSIDYLGGRYAVKQIYSSPMYLEGIVDGVNSLNSEAEFLRNILENKDLKTFEPKVVDGRTLLPLELPTRTIIPSSPSDTPKSLPEGNVSNPAALETTVPLNTTTPTLSPTSTLTPTPISSGVSTTSRFYVDKDKFQLYMVEEYRDGRVAMTLKNISTKDLTVAKDKITTDIFNENDISGIEIKKVQVNYDDVVSSKESKLADFIKKYNVYYVSGYDIDISSVYDIKSNEQKSQLSVLYSNKDFNPLITTSITPESKSALLGQYMQGLVSFYIFAEEPETLNAKFPDSKKTSINLSIDGVSTPATLIEVNPNLSEGGPVKSGTEEKMPAEIAPVKVKYSEVVFKSNQGYWYKFSSSEDPTGKVKFKEGLEMKKLDEQKARELDNKKEEKEKNNPQLSQVKLDQIPQEMRLLPGDLKAKGFTAGVLEKSSKKGSESNCDKYYLDTYPINCITEKLDGFNITFVGTNTPDKELPNNKDMPVAKGVSFSYVVVKAKADDAKALIQKVDWKVMYQKSEPYVLKEFDGKTVILIGALSKEEMNKILDNVRLDNGFNELKKQVEESERLSITNR